MAKCWQYVRDTKLLSGLLVIWANHLGFFIVITSVSLLSMYNAVRSDLHIDIDIVYCQIAYHVPENLFTAGMRL